MSQDMQTRQKNNEMKERQRNQMPEDELDLKQVQQQASQIQPEIIHINQFLSKNQDQNSNQVGCKDGITQLQCPSENKKGYSNCQDLIDLSAEPETIQPRFSSRNSQEELRRQFYQCSFKDEQRQGCELSKKNDLTDHQADCNMKEFKQIEEKTIKSMSDAKKGEESGGNKQRKSKQGWPSRKKSREVQKQNMP